MPKTENIQVLQEKVMDLAGALMDFEKDVEEVYRGLVISFLERKGKNPENYTKEELLHQLLCVRDGLGDALYANDYFEVMLAEYDI